MMEIFSLHETTETFDMSKHIFAVSKKNLATLLTQVALEQLGIVVIT